MIRNEDGGVRQRARTTEFMVSYLLPVNVDKYLENFALVQNNGTNDHERFYVKRLSTIRDSFHDSLCIESAITVFSDRALNSFTLDIHVTDVISTRAHVPVITTLRTIKLYSSVQSNEFLVDNHPKTRTAITGRHRARIRPSSVSLFVRITPMSTRDWQVTRWPRSFRLDRFSAFPPIYIQLSCIRFERVTTSG